MIGGLRGLGRAGRRSKSEAICLHDWESTKAWGVIIGLSRCKRCGKIATSDDFPAIKDQANG